MFRRPGYGGRSKASADTLCQKCLKRGHYSYECTVSAQERPYKSRPSRTQQLLNPTLKPKLTTEVPNELLRKKGVADELLKKKDEERGRKSSRDDRKRSRKHSRSASISSYDSVSTISTNRSPSVSKSPKRNKNSAMRVSKDKEDQKLGKRGRRSISSVSYSSHDSHDRDRNTRRRMSSFSPARERGRRRSRSDPSRMDMDMSYDGGSRHRASRRRVSSRGRKGPRSRSRSGDRYVKRPVKRLSLSRSRSRSSSRMDTSEDRHPPRNSESQLEPAVDPIPRGRWVTSPGAPRRSRSPPGRRGAPRSRSPFRGGRSPSPLPKRRAHQRSRSPFRPQNGDEQYGEKRNRADDEPVSITRNGPPAVRQPPPRERSLSPYSKRVAMTRAMQAGH